MTSGRAAANTRSRRADLKSSTCSVAAGFASIGRPVLRLSTMATVWPSARSRSTTCEPMKPAPPVTSARTRLSSTQPLTVPVDREPQAGVGVDVRLPAEQRARARDVGLPDTRVVLWQGAEDDLVLGAGEGNDPLRELEQRHLLRI